PLTPQAGTYLICAAHYIGPEGMELARQGAVELRKRHKMPAFIFNRGEEERRKQREYWGNLAKQHPGVPVRRPVRRIHDQFAVLIGGFKDMDSAHKSLARVKKLPLPRMKLEGGKSPYDLMTYTEKDKKGNPVVKRAPVNPFHNAMVVRNPLVPAVHQQKSR